MNYMSIDAKERAEYLDVLLYGPERLRMPWEWNAFAIVECETPVVLTRGVLADILHAAGCEALALTVERSRLDVGEALVLVEGELVIARLTP
jgi:hypothetical protein